VHGAIAKRLCTGLQIRSARFDSGSRLQKNTIRINGLAFSVSNPFFMARADVTADVRRFLQFDQLRDTPRAVVFHVDARCLGAIVHRLNYRPPVMKSSLALGLLVAGCASSGVVPADKGSFMLTKVSAACGYGSPDALKTDLYREAGTHCSGQGKQLETVDFAGVQGIPVVRCASATLNFRCVAP
jgi:hypothetical protein